MSQNDFVIANQTAPNFRADLNLALQALASTSSGATAPSTTYANMLWYDTANNILKMRTEADDAWIDLGTLDQSANTFTPAGLTNLSQAQAEDDTSTVFGQVSGQRLGQAIATSREKGSSIAATTSGTAFDFTSIPAAVQRIEVLFDEIGLSGSDNLLVQLGTSGGVVTTGYKSVGVATNGPGGGVVTSTSGFIVRVVSTTDPCGVIRMTRLAPGSNVWVSDHTLGDDGGAVSLTGGGRISLAAEVTQLRVTRTGSNTFNQGQISVRWK